MAVDVPSDEVPTVAMTPAALKSSLAPVAAPSTAPAEDDLPPAPSAALRAVLAARRGEQADPAPALGSAGPRPVGTIKPVGAIEPATPRGKPATAPTAAAAAARTKTATAPKPAKAGAMVTAPGLPGDGRRKSTAQLTVVPTGPSAGAATGEATRPAATAKPQTAGKALTGLGGKAAPVRGRPRYLGLILTGILLVFLALIAAWSSYFVTGMTSDATAPAPTALSQAADPGSAPAADAAATAPGSETAVAMATAPDAGVAAAPDSAATAATDTPSAADEAAADGQDAEVAAATETDTTATAAPATDAATGTPDTVAAAATESATGLPASYAAASAASVETTPDAAAAAAVAAQDPAPAQAAAEPAPGTAVSTEAATSETAGDTAGDEIFLAAAEPPTELPDPAALPGTSATVEDSLPQAAVNPPPFGTVYKFDDQGRILPTAEGVVTPEGVTLVAGKPPEVPPDRPAAIAALAPAAAAVAPAAEPASPAPGGIPLTDVPDATAAPAANVATPPGAGADPAAAPAPFPSDPALKDFRPKSRPANLVPAATEPAPAAPADPRLAGFRPRARSATVAALAPVAEPAATDAGADPASTAGLDANPATVVSALAVDVSRLPPARPAALAQAVNAAVNQAVAEASPPADDAPAASGSSDSEPDPDAAAAAAPKIPSNASVSKTATEKDVLVMNKVALIGIFGSDSSRYAYVRLANGALKKVKVGDALDGGTVVAISATDLRYQKSGKVITLAMPRDS